MKHQIIIGLSLILLLVSQNAYAFFPLEGNNIIIQQTTGGTTTSKQGTYNQTLANNVLINKNGFRINFINGTLNPINVVNDSARQQVNVTISATGTGGGVTSLNSLSGALTIACVSGNTTCTSSGGNTITINTAWNIVTTGGSAQTITKGVTLNALTLGGDEIVGSNALSNGGHKSTLPTTSGILCQTNQTSACGTGASGVTQLNTFINKVNLTSGSGNLTVTNSSGTIKYNLGINPVILGGATQTFTKNLDFSGSSSTIDDFFGNAALAIRNTLNTFAFTIQGGAITANRTVNLGIPSSNVQISYQPIYNYTSPANQTGTNSLTVLVMNGGYATLTPRYSTNATVQVEGSAYNSVAGSGCILSLQTGSSFLGGNRAALAGTKLGSDVKFTSSGAQQNETFNIPAVATGLTTGQKQYFDVAFKAVTSGVCKIINLNWYIREQ